MPNVDLLRKAAAKLRKTANDATPGPWKTSETQEDAAVVFVAHESVKNAATVLFEADWGTTDDAAWIALASPALAEPLAAWLEEEARQWDLPPCDDPTGVCNRCEWQPSANDALAVARAVLGEVSDQ